MGGRGRQGAAEEAADGGRGALRASSSGSKSRPSSALASSALRRSTACRRRSSRALRYSSSWICAAARPGAEAPAARRRSSELPRGCAPRQKRRRSQSVLPSSRFRRKSPGWGGQRMWLPTRGREAAGSVAQTEATRDRSKSGMRCRGHPCAPSRRYPSKSSESTTLHTEASGGWERVSARPSCAVR